jgi:hypothetical protein
MFPGGFVFLSCDYSDNPFQYLLHVVSLLFALDFLANTLPCACKGILLFFFSIEDSLTSSNYPFVYHKQAVTFSDFFLADILTSMSKVTQLFVFPIYMYNAIVEQQQIYFAGFVGFRTFSMSYGPSTGQ